MRSELDKFNSILVFVVAVLGLVCGCQTDSKPKGPVTLLRLHLEASPDATGLNVPVLIGRTDPVQLTVEKSPFIDERDVAKADVIDDKGVIFLRIEFTRRGRWLLELYSTSNPGRRCAIFCQFGNKKAPASRWLAAPMFRHRITDGVLVFAPDATKAEADQIVAGLNNLAKRLAKERGPLD